jgi:hypothetical protein
MEPAFGITRICRQVTKKCPVGFVLKSRSKETAGIPSFPMKPLQGLLLPKCLLETTLTWTILLFSPLLIPASARLCFESDTLLFEVVTGGVDLMVRGLSRQGPKVTALSTQARRTGPREKPTRHQHQLACFSGTRGEQSHYLCVLERSADFLLRRCREQRGGWMIRSVMTSCGTVRTDQYISRNVSQYY